MGRVSAPWGTGGQLKVQVLTDFPERFARGATVYIDRESATIDSVQWHKGNAIIKLRDTDSIKQVEKLRGKTVEIRHHQLQPLPSGQYYHFQLIGLEVWTTGGERIGKITGVLSGAGNDNYVVRGDRGEILIPAIEDVVKSIDLKLKRVIIEPIAGLLNLNQKADG